jgi:hypothetical protein
MKKSAENKKAPNAFSLKNQHSGKGGDISVILLHCLLAALHRQTDAAI